MFSKPPSEEQQPVSSGELATLVDLGLSDDPIAGYFGGERVRSVSAFWRIGTPLAARTAAGRDIIPALGHSDAEHEKVIVPPILRLGIRRAPIESPLVIRASEPAVGD
jgi:hypothetical protein